MKFIYNFLFLLIFLFEYSSIKSFQLHRVILATNANSNYIEFWPIVAKAWKEIVGLQPTLALIADASVKVDESLGDVIRFDPIEGVSTALHAQAIRHLLPALFEDEGCIISDIDMVPLCKEYFTKSVEDIGSDKFVVYRDGLYDANMKSYPMCYCAAYGKVYKEVFGVKTINDIPEIIKSWSSLNFGWNTDELLLYKYLNSWNKFSTHCVKLGHAREVLPKRIDRSRWHCDLNLVKSGYYIDAHCPRPYSVYKESIDRIVQNLTKNS